MTNNILFLTHSEHGQSNIVLACATAVAHRPGCRVHIASFDDLDNRVARLNDSRAQLDFHALPGKSMKATVSQLYPEGADTMVRAPGLLGAIQTTQIWASICLGAGPKEYLQTYKAIQQLIREIIPAALVIDALFMQGHDAARGLNLSYITIDPISAQMSVGLAAEISFMNFPMAGLGSQYPLSLVDKLRNYVFVLAALTVLQFPRSPLPAILKARKEAGISHKVPSIPSYRSQDLYLCPHVPETNFPGGTALPSNVVGLPPVVLRTGLSPSPTDLALLEWLKQGPTALVNFGSSDAYTDSKAVAPLAHGIRLLLESQATFQVLWKTKCDCSRDTDLKHVVDSLLRTGRLRITPWLTMNPSELLETDSVVCSVHHGGANSFYEACRAGIPQLILPLWADTFVFAERARFLGFGLIGNSGTAPLIDASQFATSLQRVMTDGSISKAASEIGRVCREMGDGEQLAATAIVQWAETRHSTS